MKCIFRGVVLVAIFALFVLGCDPVGPSTDEGPGELPNEPVVITPISPGFHDQSEKASGENYEHWLFISRLAPGAPISDAQTAHESYAGIPVGPDTTYRYWSFALDFSSAHGSDGGPAGGSGWKQSGGKRDIRILMKSPEGKLIQVINAGIPATPEAEDTFKDAVAAAFGLDASMLPALDEAESSSVTYDPSRLYSDPVKSGCATGQSSVLMEWMWNDQNGYHMDGIVVCVHVISGDEGYGGGGGSFGGTMEPSNSRPYLHETIGSYDGFDATGSGSCADCGGDDLDFCASDDPEVLLANGCIEPEELKIPDMTDDFAPLDTLSIDCSNPQGWRAYAYCAAAPPEGQDLKAVQDAFNRIKQRGDACLSIASHGQGQLQSGMIRFYPKNVHPDAGGGFSWVGRPIHLSDRWIRYGADSGIAVTDPTGEVVRLSLDMALVHELEHNLGRDHIVVNGTESLFLTPNVLQCSGQ